MGSKEPLPRFAQRYGRWSMASPAVMAALPTSAIAEDSAGMQASFGRLMGSLGSMLADFVFMVVALSVLGGAIAAIIFAASNRKRVSSGLREEWVSAALARSDEAETKQVPVENRLAGGGNPANAQLMAKADVLLSQPRADEFAHSAEEVDAETRTRIEAAVNRLKSKPANDPPSQ